MTHAYICDAIRTPFGRYGGALSSVRTDDLGAIPIKALMARNPNVDWGAVTDVLYGCANQAGEDNRNVAHMPVCRWAWRAPPSTGCAAPAWTRWAPPRAPSAAGMPAWSLPAAWKA